MSREFTLKVLKYEQRLRENAFKALKRTKEDLMQEEFAVQNEILYDKLYTKFKVEQDTYNQALSLHKLNLDPEVQAIVAKTNAKCAGLITVIESKFTEFEEEYSSHEEDDLTTQKMHMGVDLTESFE